MKKLLILMILTLTTVFTSINAQGFYLSFDGVDDYVDLGSVYNSDNSFSLYAKFETNNINTGDQVVFSFLGSRNVYMRIRDNGVLNWTVFDGSTDPYLFSSSNAIAPNTVHEAVVVRDKSNGMKLYLDGVLVDSNTFTGNGNVVNAFDSIGVRADVLSSYFDGNIYDIKLYDQVLSNTDAENLSNGQSISATPRNHWDFQDGSGTTLTDIEGTNDGTIVGATWQGSPAVTYPVDINLTSNYGDYFDVPIEFGNSSVFKTEYPINETLVDSNDNWFVYEFNTPSNTGDFVFQHWYDLDNDEIFSTNLNINTANENIAIDRDFNLQAVYSGVAEYDIDLNMESGISGDIVYQGISFSGNTIGEINNVIDQTVPAGTEWSATAPNVDGYNFDGWYFPNGTLNTTSQTLSTTDTQFNFNFEARYSQVPTYLIDATSDLPSPPDFQFQVDQEPVILEYPVFQFVEENKNVSITAPTANIGFYEFDGWYDVSTNTLLESNSTILFSNINEDKEIIARYTLPDEYQIDLQLSSNIGNITFQVDNETPIIAPVIDETIFEGQSFTAQGPTDPDYAFQHWYDLDNDGIFTFSFTLNEQNVSRSYNLEARYLEIFELTFNSAGGTSVSSITALDGDVIDLPEPTREGFGFGGWYETSDPFQVVVSEPFTPTSDIDFTAFWIPIITVSFNSNGGSSVPSQSVSTAGIITEPAIPSRFAYQFEGWYLDNNTFANEYDFTSPIPFNYDFTLHAKWTLGSDSDFGGTINEWIVNSGISSMFIMLVILSAVSITLGLINAQMFVIIISNLSIIFVFTALGFIPIWVVLVSGLAVIGFILMAVFGGSNNG